MLLKWLLLAILAWYIYRTGRNLVRAALGRPEEPLTGRGGAFGGGTFGGGASDPRGGASDPRGGRGRADADTEPVRVHVNNAAHSSSARPPDNQIEDARFEDV